MENAFASLEIESGHFYLCLFQAKLPPGVYHHTQQGILHAHVWCIRLAMLQMII